jgi:hypothetical protein
LFTFDTTRIHFTCAVDRRKYFLRFLLPAYNIALNQYSMFIQIQSGIVAVAGSNNAFDLNAVTNPDALRAVICFECKMGGHPDPGSRIF